MQIQPNNYLRVNIQHPSLDSHVWLEFTKSKHLTEEKILGKIEAMQQSKKECLISDGSTELDIVHVKYHEGTVERRRNTFTWTRKILKRKRELSFRSTTLGILCVCPVPLLSPVSMPKDLKFPPKTRSSFPVW
jgi:hypothetical protein